MSRSQPIKEELELDALLAHEQELLEREREFARNQERIERERHERERTMPPLDELKERARRRQHEEIVSRGEVANIRRVQNRSLLMLMLLAITTATLIWWGLKLMQAG
ncbi:MAG: hypothetical protein R3242_02170 [Akkermansiaceae bacterium]|nr:hypothetical protein [Akkermansiaceae bacterium]